MIYIYSSAHELEFKLYRHEYMTKKRVPQINSDFSKQKNYLSWNKSISQALNPIYSKPELKFLQRVQQ